jgi:hypothetical protein
MLSSSSIHSVFILDSSSLPALFILYSLLIHPHSSPACPLSTLYSSSIDSPFNLYSSSSHPLCILDPRGHRYPPIICVSVRCPRRVLIYSARIVRCPLECTPRIISWFSPLPDESESTPLEPSPASGSARCPLESTHPLVQSAAHWNLLRSDPVRCPTSPNLFTVRDPVMPGLATLFTLCSFVV